MKFKDIEIGKTYIERSTQYHEGSLLLVTDIVQEQARSWSTKKITRIVAKRMWRWDAKHEWGGVWKYMPNQIAHEMTIDEFKQMKLDASDREKKRASDRKHAATAAEAYVAHLDALGLPSGLGSFGIPRVAKMCALNGDPWAQPTYGIQVHWPHP